MELVPCMYPTNEEFSNPIEYLSQRKIQRLGSRYGMIKLIPPKNFNPPVSIDKSKMKFKVRLQNLSELNILNRARKIFVKQLNNFNFMYDEEMQHLKSPFVKVKGAEMKLYLYDLFIEILKHHNGDLASEYKSVFSSSSSSRKRKRDEYQSDHEPRHLSFPSLDVVLKNHKLWIHLETKFKVPESKIRSVFSEYISDYYRYVSNEVQQAEAQKLRNVLYDEAEPNSMIKTKVSDYFSELNQDQENGTDENSDGGDDYEECSVCQKGVNIDNPKILECQVCYNMFHDSCVSYNYEVSMENWICNNCIVGSGYYGFEMTSESLTFDQFQKITGNISEYDYDHELKDPVKIEQLEQQFWDYVNDENKDKCVLYGADICDVAAGTTTGFPTKEYMPDSIKTDDEKKDYVKYIDHPMNLKNLPKAKGSLLPIFGRKISGMTAPWMYIGSEFSTFCWHLEDQYTLSANYQHEGAPKIWYSVPEQSNYKLDSLLRDSAPDIFEKQEDLMHQLVTLMSPYDQKFKDADITCYKAIQYPNEYVVTFPRCYHAGFNCGYNFNEAVNFTVNSWIPYGLEAIEDYKITKKSCVFDMYELLLKILLRFEENGTLIDESLARQCYSYMVQAYNREVSLTKFLRADAKLILENQKVRKLKSTPMNKSNRILAKNNSMNDDQDDVICSNCLTICSLAYVQRKIIRRGRPPAHASPAKLSPHFCPQCYAEIYKNNSSSHDTLYLLKDITEIDDILKKAGNKIDKIAS